jgi:hypothetical protein
MTITTTFPSGATAATITISTTPPIGSGVSLERRSPNRSPLVGVVARVIAGMTGVLLGLAIGLVSAGFDTTRLLLALGAVALGVGWLTALAIGPATTSPNHS